MPRLRHQRATGPADETRDWAWTEDADMPSEAELDEQIAALRPPPRPLTEWQLSVLLALSHGFTISDIAAETGKSYLAVQDVMKHVRRKLAAKSNSHAVAVAIRTGLIE